MMPYIVILYDVFQLYMKSVFVLGVEWVDIMNLW